MNSCLRLRQKRDGKYFDSLDYLKNEHLLMEKQTNVFNLRNILFFKLHIGFDCIL